MSTLRKVDLDAIKAHVRIADVLASAGIDVPARRHRLPCPLHKGTNPESFSFTEDKFFCHAEGAGGDVIELARRLHGIDFRSAVAHVAAIAGFDSGQLPRQDSRAADDRAKAARRRAALRHWRTRRLTELAAALHALDSDASWLHQLAVGAHVRGDAATLSHWLDLMRDVYVAVESAEWLTALLERTDENLWAALWLVEHRAEAAR